ncbi:MAG TPA: 4Fe-4S binding protein [Ruminiclostridium sp.]
MRRQNLRKASILISFLLFPITIYYFSPYLIIQGATEGIITGSFIVFGIMMLTSLFSGRLFCSWLCPVGGLQECMTLISDKKARGGKLNWIKYMIWVPWISIIAILIFAAGGFKKVDFLYLTTNGISVADPTAYFIYYGVLLLIVIISLTSGKRGFCHYSCWMSPFMIIGTKIKDYLNIPSVRLIADQSKCISCKQCTKKCPMSLEVEQMVKKGCMRNSECILCGECVDVCPKSVIKYSLKK